MKRLNVDVPLGWSQLLIRFVTILVIGMILLNIKEYRDAGVFDVPATLVDATLIAVGVVALNAILMLAMPLRPQEQPLSRQ